MPSTVGVPSFSSYPHANPQTGFTTRLSGPSGVWTRNVSASHVTLPKSLNPGASKTVGRTPSAKYERTFVRRLAACYEPAESAS
jgi:hypothetical protein